MMVRGKTASQITRPVVDLAVKQAQAETAAKLVAAYAAEQPISTQHGSPLAPRPTYEKAGNALAVVDVANPATDVDAAPYIVYPFGQDIAAGGVVPKALRTSDIVRGFNPNLMVRNPTGSGLTAMSCVTSYSASGLETELEPGSPMSANSNNKIVDFTFDSDVFYLVMDRSVHGALCVHVDGAMIVPTITGPVVIAGAVPGEIMIDAAYVGGRYVKFKFPSVATRRIMIVYAGDRITSKLYFRNTATVTFNRGALRWITVGDSFTAGSVSDTGAIANVYGRRQAYAHAMHGAFGFEFDQINIGIGGSGFLKNLLPGAEKTLGQSLSYRRSLLTNTAGLDADLITVLGCVNDAGSYADPLFANEMAAFIDDARAMHPRAMIVVFGTNTSIANIPTISPLIEAKMAEICAAKGVPFVPMQTRNPPFLRGTGKQDAPTGTGNTDYMVGPDSTHPTVLGHRLTGEFMARELSRVAQSIR